MAKEIDKIIQSKTAPKSNNVLWDDGENLKIYRNGVWENTNKNAGGEIDPVIWKYMCNPIDINPILHSVDLDGNEDILGEKYRPENYGYEVYKFKPNVCAGMFRQIYHTTKTLGELWNISYINHDEGMITFSGHGGDEIMFAVIDDGERIIWHEVDW